MCNTSPFSKAAGKEFSAALQARMTQTAEILRPTDNRDRYGAVTQDDNRVARRYKCRVLRSAEPQAPVVNGEKSVVRSEWAILFSQDAEIHSDDIIRVDGVRYEILDHDRGRADASFLTVNCRRMA
jgi:hypothetical protein